MVVKKLRIYKIQINMLNEVNIVFDIAEVSVGQHYYWEIGGYSVHGQVLMTSWFVFAVIAAFHFQEIAS